MIDLTLGMVWSFCFLFYFFHCHAMIHNDCAAFRSFYVFFFFYSFLLFLMYVCYEDIDMDRIICITS